MKKVTYMLFTALMLTTSGVVNSTSVKLHDIEKTQSTKVSTTDIFNYLNTNLGLSATQKPAVKTAVDEAGSEVTKLNTSTTKSVSEIATAKTSIVNGLIKKLSSGILSGTQSAKLSSLSSKLTSMFSQLK